MNYYIHHPADDIHAAIEGPLDLMAVIRRIRKGTVEEETRIAPGEGLDPIAAKDYPEFAEFFNRTEDEELPSLQAGSGRPRSLKKQLGIGVEFLNENWGVSIFSGVFMALWVMIWAVFARPDAIVGITIAIFLSYFFFGPFFYGVLRLLRGHPLSAGSILAASIKSSVGLLVASLIIALLLLPFTVLATTVLTGVGFYIGLPIFFLVLLTIWTIFAYVPLLLMDKNHDFYDAVRISMEKVARKGAEKFGIVFALVAINFIFFPLLLLVLPITMAGLADMYEEDVF